MRVLIDTTYALRGRTGTGVYLEHLVPALRDAGVDVVTVQNEDRRAPAGGGLGSLRNLADDRRWIRHALPRLVEQHGADVLHHPLPDRAKTPVAQVVTVHDVGVAVVPQAFDRRFRLYAHLVQRPAARKADAVIVPSTATANEAVRVWGLDAQQIVVATHGPGQALPPRPRPEPPRHLLYVGDNEPRKNVQALRDAHAAWHAQHPRDALPLVLAGRGHADGPHVAVEADAGPERLADLHAQALALVHPARHEGFGLTVLEAMAAGTPVIASAIPALDELMGDTGLPFDLNHPETLPALFEELATEPTLRDALAANGTARAAAFTWVGAAQSHVEAYTLAVARHGAGAGGSH
jgi:glycosyltransferase involved in cell wall biosynthesis